MPQGNIWNDKFFYWTDWWNDTPGNLIWFFDLFISISHKADIILCNMISHPHYIIGGMYHCSSVIGSYFSYLFFGIVFHNIRIYQELESWYLNILQHVLFCEWYKKICLYKETWNRRNSRFSLWVFFHEHSRFIGQQGKGEAISLTPLYHLHSLHRQLDIARRLLQRAQLCT